MNTSKTNIAHVEPEQIVIKVEPRIHDLVDHDTDITDAAAGLEGFYESLKEKFHADSTYSYEANSRKVDRKCLEPHRRSESKNRASHLLTSKVASSRLREDVIDQKEKCLNEVLKLFPSMDYQEVLDVLVRHRWALGVSIRHIRSTIKYKRPINITAIQQNTKIKKTNGVHEDDEQVRHVISSFSVDHRMEAAHKIEIKEKEKCLHELGTLFPMHDCLELQDVLVRHHWSVKASTDFLKSRKNVHVKPRNGKCYLYILDSVPNYLAADNVVMDSRLNESSFKCDLAEKIKRAFKNLSSVSQLQHKLEPESITNVDDVVDNRFTENEGTTMEQPIKENCLRTLISRFPNISMLTIYDVIVRHNWSVSASTKYLKSGNVRGINTDVVDCAEDNGNYSTTKGRKAAIAASKNLTALSFYKNNARFSETKKRGRPRQRT